ncbi:MAG: RluA family pseudouridine synthase [Verrucomicrobia bacterium]|nr:RluA family pseudouridine synthase [Verrucomicrobiota bacterium]
MQTLPPILFEDESLIAFDKPSGLLVAPDRWDKELANLMQMVHERLSPEIFNVHRLDRETSGVLLCAKTRMSRDHLSRQFQLREVAKRYEAIVRGVPPEDEMLITLAVLEDERHPGRMRTSRARGRHSETRVKVLTRWRGYTRVEVFPKTGRTHQVRVHLASQGCPVLADPLYGDGQGLMLSALKRGYKQKRDEPERPLLGRLALHAESLGFIHPVEKKPMTISSPLPKEFEIAIKYLRRFAGL